MWGWISNFSTKHSLFHHQMIRYANNSNICPLCLCIFILVFIYWTKSPHTRRVRPAWSASRRCSLFLFCTICVCVSITIFPPLPSRASMSLHETLHAFISSMMNYQKGEVQTLLLNQAPPSEACSLAAGQGLLNQAPCLWIGWQGCSQCLVNKVANNRWI